MGFFKKFLRLLRISKNPEESNRKMSGINSDDDYTETPPKKSQSVYDINQAASSDEIEVAGTSSNSSDQVPLPSIFKLTIDCFDEIFEYLNVKDLHSFGQTCTRMNKVAGEYFKRNYKRCEKFTHYNGIYTVYSDHEGVSNERTQTSGFNRFIHNISQYYENVGPLSYIETSVNEFESVGDIYFVCTCIDAHKIKNFKPILPQVETIRLHQCTGRGDVYEVLLQFCTNLKNLTIYDDVGYIINSYRRNDWLNKCYPKLEHITLSPRINKEIPDLSAFFQQNASVQSFSTTSQFLWMNQGQLDASNVKLNVLGVEFTKKFGSNLSSLGQFRDLFNEMHGKGIFKGLHLTVERINQQFCDEIVSLPAVEKLTLREFNEIYSLHQLTGLKELTLPSGLTSKDIEMLANNLVNLHTVSISSVTSNDLLPFMRCAKLRKLYAYLNGGILNLSKLNKERGKLGNAWKVVIYLNQNIFLATKWSIGNTNLKFVEIKRSCAE
ncbi:uncharacterized protein LOC116350376 isoform X2 [Contarinia nasturtii]|nr:uncharacterized protein LOC116350376 isoform X2 [Contarinia nasturtii]XP_031638017.1 uncharacterized protein LOC116350376 isoform X2 [Contarinia nasturtii]XP_031638018.1 uncharacterized protein LOC116350376 isoform X2 [Contarinia nasturtii]XP_031638019.1 uncharacterized protein LOC116350376 isoform X2 [Contarinia nasturtii]